MPIEIHKTDVRPRAADWLWHRWYAKLYWAASAVFWGTFVAVWLVSLETGFFRSTAGAYAMLVFNPITVLLLLGVGYIRALIVGGQWEWKDSADASSLWPYAFDGKNDLADASNPLSPNWVGSPQSQARRYGDN